MIASESSKEKMYDKVIASEASGKKIDNYIKNLHNSNRISIHRVYIMYGPKILGGGGAPKSDRE